MMVFAGKQSSADKGVEPRIRVTSWNVDAEFPLAIFFPLDGDAMCCIFGRNAKLRRNEPGPNVF